MIHDIGMLTSPRTALSILLTTSMLMLAPLGALALGAGPSGVTSDTEEGVLAPGAPGGLINTAHNPLANTATSTSSSQIPHGTAAGHPNTVSTIHPPGDTSAVDPDSNLSTTPAPQGTNMKSDLGLGVEARMPGAAGR